MATLPQDLQAVLGPFDENRVRAAAESFGDFGRATRLLHNSGIVSPDVLMGMSLTLLTGQPRTRRDESDGLASAIEGNVWVREQLTIHRPCRIDEKWTVVGSSARHYVRKGRRYGVTTSRTVDGDGLPFVTNCTTGLLSYRADGSLEDGNEGSPESEVHIPTVDYTGALSGVDVAAETGKTSTVSEPVEMTLALMQHRDGESPTNPIHSDPEKAKRAGLRAPIAGGSHVAGFAFELLMREWGPEVLLHGAHIDVRWKSPTFAGDLLEPSAVVTSVTDELVTIDIAVEPSKLRGTIRIPRASV